MATASRPTSCVQRLSLNNSNYASYMKVGSEGVLGFSRVYPAKQFGPYFIHSVIVLYLYDVKSSPFHSLAIS